MRSLEDVVVTTRNPLGLLSVKLREMDHGKSIRFDYYPIICLEAVAEIPVEIRSRGSVPEQNLVPLSRWVDLVTDLAAAQNGGSRNGGEATKLTTRSFHT